jgi:coiled-coil domain-containing protein 64
LCDQILEQEKHVLRRKVDNVEGEYESKVSELQSDVADLRRALDEQQNNVKMAERQKSSIITQLTEQNQRLTAQLKEVRRYIRPIEPPFLFFRNLDSFTNVRP